MVRGAKRQTLELRYMRGENLLIGAEYHERRNNPCGDHKMAPGLCHC